jgi:hypothetical protein
VRYAVLRRDAPVVQLCQTLVWEAEVPVPSTAASRAAAAGVAGAAVASVADLSLDWRVRRVTHALVAAGGRPVCLGLLAEALSVGAAPVIAAVAPVFFDVDGSSTAASHRAPDSSARGIDQESVSSGAGGTAEPQPPHPLKSSPSAAAAAVAAASAEMEKFCVVCLDEPKQGAFMPCAHMCCCMKCGLNIVSLGQACPICRKNCPKFLRIYL